MKKALMSIAVCFAASISFALEDLPPDAKPAPQAIFNFDRDALRKPPERFSFAVAGQCPGIRW